MKSATEKAAESPMEAGPVIQAVDIGREGASAVAVGPPGLPPKLSAGAIRDEKRRAVSRSPFGLLLHAWRLKRVRWAMATLNRRMAAYEAAYGTGAFQMTDEDLRSAGVRRDPH